MSQPEFPLGVDALDVGATATRYQGDPVVTRIDSDGDGRVDRVEVDLDADGDAEITETDTDGDGVVDDAHIDLTGRSDVVGFGDTDGDGHYETILRDTDGDGVADRHDLDLDGDSVADRVGTGLDPADPFTGPTYAVDPLPAPRDGITEHSLDGFGAGASERDLDYEQEARNEFGESLVGPAFGDGAVDPGPVAEEGARAADYEQESLDAFGDPLQGVPADAVAAPAYEPPADASSVDDAYYAQTDTPVFAPVAEASQVDEAMAAPDDDYVG